MENKLQFMATPGFDLNKVLQNREIRQSEEHCAKLHSTTQKSTLGTLSLYSTTCYVKPPEEFWNLVGEKKR